MNKKELAVALAKHVGLSQVKAMECLNALFDVDSGIIAAQLEAGNKVSVPGFGTFAIKTRAARVGTSPSNKARIEIPEKKFPAFKAGKTLKERLVVVAR
jgi:DNA-binding protein HU-beta